jgi:hypothetical protein
MSVWPKPLPAGPLLLGSEGELISVSIEVDPRRLEALLEALAQVPFPINPEIFHDAAVVYRYPGGRERIQNVTLVEFPAFSSRLAEVRRALEANGFDPADAHAAGMLEEIHREQVSEPVPDGADYIERHLVKRRTTAVH